MNRNVIYGAYIRCPYDGEMDWYDITMEMGESLRLVNDDDGVHIYTTNVESDSSVDIDVNDPAIYMFDKNEDYIERFKAQFKNEIKILGKHYGIGNISIHVGLIVEYW